MIRFVFLLSVGMLISCSAEENPPGETIEGPAPAARPPAKDTTAYIMPFEADSVKGDFDGDGKQEFAFSALVQHQKGSPQDGGSEAQYAIHFSNGLIPPVNVFCCEFRLFNEGDLDGNGSDELSIFQHRLNGCTGDLQTFTFGDHAFKPFIENMLVPTGCDYYTDSMVQALVFGQNGKVYRMEIEDMNDPAWKRLKKEVKVLP